MTDQPRTITLELPDGAERRIARCCDRPRPVAMGVSHSNNTRLWSTVVKCAVCATELVVLRWRLPAALDTIGGQQPISDGDRGSRFSIPLDDV